MITFQETPVTPVVNLSNVNREKEVTRYQFREMRDMNDMFSVYRKGKHVGTFSANGFVACRGYANLNNFVQRAFAAHLERQRVVAHGS